MYMLAGERKAMRGEGTRIVVNRAASRLPYFTLIPMLMNKRNFQPNGGRAFILHAGTKWDDPRRFVFL